MPVDPAGQTPFRLGPGGLVVVIVPGQLVAACARRGWSLTHLARRADISYPTLKAALQGKSVRPRTAWKLARALAEETSPSELDQLLEAS
jgi:lambda repressor-like predicted transcriptional regulator